jgi:hypothetical protein
MRKSVSSFDTSHKHLRVRLGVACSAIFVLAVVIRVFHFQDNPTAPFNGMTGEYRNHAMFLVKGDIKTFLGGPNPPSNANVIKHPPGYPLLMALVYKLAVNSDTALRFVQVVFDASAAVLVVLIAAELFSFGVAVLSGFLVALSPQLAYHSVALLPDPLAAPPLLLSAYLLVRAYKHPRLLTLFASGVMIGVSCWFRSNTMLLPLFLCAAMPVLFIKGKRTRFAIALVVGFLLVIIPITVRNAIFFHAFIPLSLSAGITLVEGIGVYDKEKRLGLPENDYLVTKWEAQEFGRPDYLGERFSVDGVIRERHRIKRGLAVVTAHPLWFLGVMIHRASSMLRLARVELVRAQPPVRHSISISGNVAPGSPVLPADASQPAGNLERRITSDGQGVVLSGSAQDVFVSNPVLVKPQTDYLLRVPLKLKEGEVVIEVLDAQSYDTLAFTPILHPIHWLDLTPEQQPMVTVDVPFVSLDTTRVIFKLRDPRRSPQHTALELGVAEAFELGPATQTWARFPRFIVGILQRLFITAVMLPVTILGVVFLIRQRRWPEMVLLLSLPAYYMCVQSALWTEFRYILSMHYLLLILAAVGFVWIGKTLAQAISRSNATKPN